MNQPSLFLRRALCATVVAAAAFPVLAQPVAATSPSGVTLIRLVSAPGDYVGQGATSTYSDPSTIQVQGGFGGVRASVNAGVEWWHFDLAPAVGQRLLPGSYANALRSAGTGHPGVDVYGDGRGCNQTFGSFTINTIAFDAHGALTELDARYIQHCESLAAPMLKGVIKFHAPPAQPVTMDVVTPSTVLGEPVSLAALVAPGTTAPTGTVTFLDGANTIGTAKVRGDGTAVLTTAALAVGAHSIVARYSGDAAHAAATSNAAAQQVAPNAISLWFQSVYGDSIGSGVQAAYTPPSATIYVSGTKAGVNVGVTEGSDWWYVNIAPHTGGALHVGVYGQALRFADATHPEIQVYGNGRGCNQDFGKFTVNAIAFDSSGNVKSINFDFMQTCESSTAPPMRGSVHWHK